MVIMTLAFDMKHYENNKKGFENASHLAYIHTVNLLKRLVEFFVSIFQQKKSFKLQLIIA